MKNEIEPELTITTPQRRDIQPLLNLLSSARWKHVHLDWFESRELLQRPPVLLAHKGNRLIACMACPPEPDRVSWLRMFLVDSRYEPESLWTLLWPQIKTAAATSGIDQIAVLCTTRWLSPILYQENFEYETDVIFLERAQTTPPAVRPIGEKIREMTEEDLTTITRLDNRAFAPIWRHSLDAMQRALRQASLATVIEQEGELLGYQICTSSMFGAHLARVAIDPACQKKGLGTALVADAIQTLNRLGQTRISVNTQANNFPSQKLYERLGFKRTGTRYPILSQRLHTPIA